MQINQIDPIQYSHKNTTEELIQNSIKSKSLNMDNNNFGQYNKHNQMSQNDEPENLFFVFEGVQDFENDAKEKGNLETKKNEEDKSRSSNSQWNGDLIILNNIEEQTSFQQTNEYQNNEQIKVIQNLQDSKTKIDIEKQKQSQENGGSDLKSNKKLVGTEDQNINCNENLKIKQHFIQYLVEKSNNKNIQVQQIKQKEDTLQDLMNSFSTKTENEVSSKRRFQFKRSYSEQQIPSETNLKDKNKHNYNLNNQRMQSVYNIIDLDQSANQIITRANTNLKEDNEDVKQTLDLQQDFTDNQQKPNHKMTKQYKEQLQEHQENEEEHKSQNNEQENNQGSEIINLDNQVLNENISQNEQEQNIQNQEQVQAADASVVDAAAESLQNQSDECSFQLQQTQAYISSLRYRLELKIQSINSLNIIFTQKVKFKQISLTIFYLPLCIAFTYLLARNTSSYCEPLILAHFILYTVFSYRNFLLNIYIMIKSKQFLKILSLYDNNILSHNPFYFILSELQGQYKKQQELQNKIQQINAQQKQDQDEGQQNDNASQNNNNNINNENIENNEYNPIANNYMQANAGSPNQQPQNNQQNANSILQIMQNFEQNIPQEYIQLVLAAVQYQNSQQQQLSAEVSNGINQINNALIQLQNGNNMINNLNQVQYQSIINLNQVQYQSIINNNNFSLGNQNNNILSSGINNNNSLSIGNQNNNIQNDNQNQNQENALNQAEDKSNLDQQNQQKKASIENYYLIQIFNLSTKTTLNDNILKNILLNSPLLKDNRICFYHYQKNLLDLNQLQFNTLKETDYLIENNQQMIYQINQNTIQREIETIIKYKDNVRLSKILKVYSFLEEYYLVIYNIVQFTFSFCYPSEGAVSLVFSFYYSIFYWLQLIFVSSAIIFMLLALIFYFFVQILTCKRKKNIKTQSLTDIKNILLSTKKYTAQEISELCCIICLVEFEEKDQVYLSDCCKRCFHKTCIMEWFKVNQKCPMCRAVVQQ